MDYQALLLRAAGEAGIGIVEISRLLRLTAELIAAHPSATAAALTEKLLTLSLAPRAVRYLAAEAGLAAAPRQHSMRYAA